MKHRISSLLRAAGLVALSLFISASRVSAEEAITGFHSDIVVHEDAEMTVTETISVISEGRKINHGIYRDFPTIYSNPAGVKRTVGFRVLRVLRDGGDEPYHIGDIDNGKRVYIGSKDMTIEPGEHIFMLTYRTDRQLGFFADHDELYWNVTGNDWEFPIREASAAVYLPGGALGRIMEAAAYTGPQGAKGRESSQARGPEAVTFRTTRPLGPKEGMTIVVSWPKGYVHEPAAPEKFQEFMSDNRGLILGVLGLCTIIFYYLIIWVRVGKDPEAGIIMTRYVPPPGMSPAVVRYIVQMGYDDRVFASSLIDMAVKGFVKIFEQDGEYSLARKEGGTEPLAAEETGILRKLLDGREITMTQSNRVKIRAAIQELKDYLRNKYEKIYFITNKRYFIAGLSLTVLALVASGFWEAMDRNRLPFFLFICVWLSIWSFAVLGLLVRAGSLWRSAFRGGGFVAGVSAFFATLFALPFLAGEGFGIFIMGYATSVITIVLLVIAACLNYLFYHLLKAPTRAGRGLLDQIEGFRVFLSATEKDRMNMLNPPDRTPELFEKFLPYALALGVEQQWAEQFSDVISKAAMEDGTYGPGWYSGTGLSAMNVGAFASSFADGFASAVAAASTAPGSSSGGGGGGSSGGGGGGGGGGGW